MVGRLAGIGTEHGTDKEIRVNIYVGNLSFGTTEDDLREAFGAHGEVTSVALIKDRETGKSRGFGFVEMPDTAAANAAIEAFNGKPFQGRTLTVNEARPKPPRDSGSGRSYRSMDQ